MVYFQLPLSIRKKKKTLVWHFGMHAISQRQGRQQNIYIYALADAFIQSDLQCIQAIHYYLFFYQYVCSLGIEPKTFCAANAMLYH